MFSENKSELSIPVVGFILLGFAALFAGISVFNMEWDFLNNTSSTVESVVYLSAGLLLVLMAFLAFRQVFLIEGMVFGMFGLLLSVIGYSVLTGGAVANLVSFGLLGFMLSVVAAITAFMSYRAGDIFVTLISMFMIIAFIPLYFTDSNLDVAVTGIGFIAIAVISLIYAVMDWMLVQDIAADIAEYMYGDDVDSCGCACGCEEHKE